MMQPIAQGKFRSFICCENLKPHVLGPFSISALCTNFVLKKKKTFHKEKSKFKFERSNRGNRSEFYVSTRYRTFQSIVCLWSQN
jgi:hypothetical protein